MVSDEVTELQEELQTLKDRKEELENQDNDIEYDDMIDETTEVVTIWGMTYNPSQVLKEVDLTAYRCGHSDYNDGLISEVSDEITEKEDEIKEALNTQ